jgi:adenylyltransferase/sulfurtransferase
VVSIISNYQCIESLKILTGNWAAINRTMINIDVWENTIRQFKVARAYDIGDCKCCKHRNFEFLNGALGSSTTTLCGRNAVQLTQKQNAGKLNFDEIASRLRSHGTVNVNKFMLRADITDNGEPYELTLFTDGRAIVKGTKEPNTAKSIYAKYVGA